MYIIILNTYTYKYKKKHPPLCKYKHFWKNLNNFKATALRFTELFDNRCEIAYTIRKFEYNYSISILDISQNATISKILSLSGVRVPSLMIRCWVQLLQPVCWFSARSIVFWSIMVKSHFLSPIEKLLLNISFELFNKTKYLLYYMTHILRLFTLKHTSINYRDKPSPETNAYFCQTIQKLIMFNSRTPITGIYITCPFFRKANFECYHLKVNPN